MARILIVDDNEMDRLLGRSALEDAGHELVFAPNGEVALRAYRGKDIDVVITDLAMPNTNGLLLIQKIMAEDSRALIIAVSGVSADQLDRAEAFGARRTLQKPYTAAQLVDTVADLLEGLRVRPPTDLWK